MQSSLRAYESDKIDLVVFRGNTEGEYADVGGREHETHDHEVAVQSAVFTREATARVVHAAFEAASERAGTLTTATKSNAQAYGMVFWDNVVEDVSEEYPESMSSDCWWTRPRWTSSAAPRIRRGGGLEPVRGHPH